ncbi:MFS transporter [Bacillus andreraoultii]|uniref:MFS transporter n=1 Tax=Bacillus andreraoultii TaxID=1499685 RepID=UPI00053A2220|nr:MFS transporter [Bacillus andreraoultii]
MMEILTYKAFMRFYSGFIISEIGTKMFYLSIFWFVQEKTQESSYTAWLGLAITIPQLFMFIFGVFADRYNRRKVMIITDICSVLILLIITTYTYLIEFSILFIAIMFSLLNICNNIFFPTSRAFMPSTLPEDKLVLGNSLFATGTQISTIIASTLGAFLLSKVNIYLFFIFNSITFLLSAFNLFLLRFVLPKESENGTVHQKIQNKEKKLFAVKQFINDIVEGFHTIKGSKILLFMIPGVFLTNIFFVTFVFLTPGWSQEILHSGSKGYSLLELGLGIGTFIGAFASGWLSKFLNIKRGEILAFLFQSTIVFFPIFPILSVNIFILFLYGIGSGLANAYTMTLIQHIIPDHQRGRAFGTLMSIMGGVVPVGTFICGLLVKYIGLTGVFWMSGIVCSIGALILALTFKFIPIKEQDNKNLLTQVE